MDMKGFRFLAQRMAWCGLAVRAAQNWPGSSHQVTKFAVHSSTRKLAHHKSHVWSVNPAKESIYHCGTPLSVCHPTPTLSSQSKKVGGVYRCLAKTRKNPCLKRIKTFVGGATEPSRPGPSPGPDPLQTAPPDLSWTRL